MIMGFAIVPRRGSLASDGPAAAILVLMEFGHLVLFDLPDLNPTPISIGLQELSELTHCLLAKQDSHSNSTGEHAVDLEGLRVYSLSCLFGDWGL